MKLTLEGETPEGFSLKLADLVAKSEYFKNGNFEFTNYGVKSPLDYGVKSPLDSFG